MRGPERHGDDVLEAHPVLIPPGHERGAGRRADRRRRVAVRQADALAREPVQIRRPDVERSIDPDTWQNAGFDSIESPNHFLDLDWEGYGKYPFEGLPRDYAAAYVWFSIAAAQAPLTDNRKGLLELRNVAAARLTPEEVSAAAQRVTAWKPR